MELTPQERTVLAAVAVFLALGAGLRLWRAAPAPPRFESAEAGSAAPPSPAAGAVAADTARRELGRLDPNRADARALEALPGIGPALARRIVEERARGGPFRSLADLEARVPGLGPKLAAKLAPHLALPGGAGRAEERPPSPARSAGRDGAAGPPPTDGAVSRRIDPNTASAAELEALPGIGPALARRIVEERARGGPFRSLADLEARVPGLGPQRAARLAPYLDWPSP